MKILKEFFRFRNLFLVWGSLVVVAYLIYSDPNDGNSVLPFIAALATPVIAVFFSHLARKALFDYIDMGTLYRKARETATGAGLVFIGICIVIFGLLSLFGSKVYAQDVTTYIPVQAQEHLPTLKHEASVYYVEHPKKNSLRA